MQWRLSRSAVARIGSDPGCEISLTGGEGIERRHAVVHYVTGRWLIESLGANGLRINETRPVRLAWLEPDDKIELSPGGVVLEFLSTSLKRAKGRRDKVPPPLAGENPKLRSTAATAPDGSKAQLDDVTRRMIWPALACGGVVAVSALTALAVVVLAGLVLMSQQDRRAENRSGEPLAPKAGVVTPTDDRQPGNNRTLPDRPPAQVAKSEPATPVPTPPTDSSPKSEPVASPPVTATNQTPPPDPTASIPSVPATPPTNLNSEQLWKLLEAGVFLIEVTNPSTKQTVPFGAAWAAGEQQLVTTAGQAIELNHFLKEGMRVIAVRQSDQGRVAVTRAVPHPQFEKLSAQRKQMFYDVGRLTLVSPTALVLELMSADDVQRLETDLPITCLGIPNGFDPMVSASSIKVQTFPGKLYQVESLRPGGPSLLHLNLDVPDHMEGSPILTAEGKVVGTYSRSAPPDIHKSIGFPLHAAASVTAVAELLQQK